MNAQSIAAIDFSVRGLSSEHAWDFENAFYWFSHPTRLNKLLAHYDLYRQILDLPGDVIELGVYKATSLIRFATFRNLLENDYSRKIIGFDAFGPFPKEKLTSNSDLVFIDKFENEGGDGLSREEVKLLFNRKCFNNVFLQKGNIFDTIPEWLDSYPFTRISLLHLDMDVKEPTAFALDCLYDRVVPNGLIVLDDYNSVAGETDAVDEFISKKKLRISKMGHYSVPAYIRKP